MLNTITMNAKTHTLRVLTDLDKAIRLATAARKNLASSSPKEAYYLLLRVSDRLEDAILAACDLYGGDFRKLPEPEEIDDPLDGLVKLDNDKYDMYFRGEKIGETCYTLEQARNARFLLTAQKIGEETGKIE